MLLSIPQAHSEVVTSLSFSPHAGQSHVLCSTSGDDTAALWDTRTTTRIASFVHHAGPVNHALFLPDAEYALLTASDDRTIGIWDTRRPDAVVGSITGFTDGVNKMLLLPSMSSGCGGPARPSSESTSVYRIASACDDGLVYTHALMQGTATPFSVTSADGAPHSVVATVDSAALLERFWVSTSTVNDLALSPDRRVLITASEDSALRTWHLLYNANATTEERLAASLDEFENPVNHVAVVPDGLLPSVAAPSGAATATTTTTSTHHHSDSGAITATTVLHRSSSAPGTMAQVHSTSDEEEGAAAGGGSTHVGGPVTTTTLTDPTAQRVALRGEDGTVYWVLAACSECVFGVDVATQTGEFGAGTKSFIGHRDYVRGLEFTAAGTLLTVSDDGTAIEWGVVSGEPIRQVKLHEGFVMASAISPQKDRLATGTDSGEIRVWPLPFQTEVMGHGSSCC